MAAQKRRRVQGAAAGELDADQPDRAGAARHREGVVKHHPRHTGLLGKLNGQDLQRCSLQHSERPGPWVERAHLAIDRMEEWLQSMRPFSRLSFGA